MPKNWIGERNEREKECQRVRERRKKKKSRFIEKKKDERRE